jgi:hypothetical protein
MDCGGSLAICNAKRPALKKVSDFWSGAGLDAHAIKAKHALAAKALPVQRRCAFMV